jgi:eukaryotic-like serine/threonine-protein kinase
MSPEQAAGDNDRIDERSDVYALSVLFYELLTLEHYLLPKVGTVSELLTAIRESDHVKACYVPSDVQPPVPAELSWFIEKGLEKDPANRYQSVGEMISALQTIIAGKFAVQCSVTFMKRAGNDAIRFADKEPKAAMFTLAAIVVLALIGLVALVRWIL